MKMKMPIRSTDNKEVNSSVEIMINGEKLNVNMKPGNLPVSIRSLLITEGLLFTDENQGVTFWTPKAFDRHIEGL